MSIVMKGLEVATAMKEEMIKKVSELKAEGISPKLAILRVGSRADDLAYEKGAVKKMADIGIECEVHELALDVSQADFEAKFNTINSDSKVHGILMFRPLPKHLDESAVLSVIDPKKDSDCMCDVNIAKVFSGDLSGYPPCTAQAVIEMLDYYKIDLTGKRVTLVGRSMVVGKPLAMLLLKRNATVTMCHTKTNDLAATCRAGEILIAAAGKAKMITADMVSEGSIVVDVGINLDENGNLCGDVDYDAVEPKAAYISPVPRGVGSITTSVLAKHVLRGAGAKF